MNVQPAIMPVSSLFYQVWYEVPIYQRNYAWGQEEIEQLLEDIYTSKDSYFLGTLIVNRKDVDTYEVIDGQQRLTTLYLLQTFLQMPLIGGALRFEAREHANRTLKALKQAMEEEWATEELARGFNVIANYFKNEAIDMKRFKERLDHVQLIRIQVPDKIDLNHYFEIMNTRGEQLQSHEIVKARLLGQLQTTEDKMVGAAIWDACAQMNTYVQMNFDSNIRKRLFTAKWDELAKEATSFESVKNLFTISSSKIEEHKTLLKLIEEKEPAVPVKEVDEEESKRFESIISFPNFILQVNEALQQSGEHESLLDDRNFLMNMASHWESEQMSKHFLFNLLKCRVLFDRYILKREYAKNYKETGKWSLQRLEAYKQEGENTLKPKYVGTFDEHINKQLRTLQACLRVTYTAPKTMHWISYTLRHLLESEEVNVLKLLENYCRAKVGEAKYKTKQGFAIERIVFTYLDYVLYRDHLKTGYLASFNAEEWDFQFRNSIEHFYPQNPPKDEQLEKWASEHLDSFGNLALINVAGNSRFSNLPPLSKVNYENAIGQSLKLVIMAKMAQQHGEWTETLVQTHKDEMLRILERDLGE